MTLASAALRAAIEERAGEALACGALAPILTDEQTLVEAGVVFSLRCVSSLQRKQRRRAAPAPAARSNPFLPPDPALFVAELPGGHRVLLNKFPVLERHLLIVTREFVHQETLLGRGDFDALAACMAAIGGLGFYNGGEAAGASQPHKHLQLVPLPLGSCGRQVPLEALLESLPRRAGLQRSAGLGLAHAFAWLDEGCFADAGAAGASLFAAYRGLCEAEGIGAAPMRGEARQLAPYNLLVTRRWMLLVRRSRERFGSVSINALGFAGSFFLRDRAQLRGIRRAGPMAVLRRVAALQE